MGFADRLRVFRAMHEKAKAGALSPEDAEDYRAVDDDGVAAVLRERSPVRLRRARPRAARRPQARAEAGRGAAPLATRRTRPAGGPRDADLERPRGIRPVHAGPGALASLLSPQRMADAARWASLPEPPNREIAVAASSPSGLALQLLVLLAFQIGTGALHRELGAPAGGFMAGAAAGAALGAGRAGRRLHRARRARAVRVPPRNPHSDNESLLLGDFQRAIRSVIHLYAELAVALKR